MLCCCCFFYFFLDIIIKQQMLYNWKHSKCQKSNSNRHSHLGLCPCLSSGRRWKKEALLFQTQELVPPFEVWVRCEAQILFDYHLFSPEYLGGEITFVHMLSAAHWSSASLTLPGLVGKAGCDPFTASCHACFPS